MGLLGLTTGMIWAQFTWGAFWVNDPKLNGTAVTLLIYLAYFILRNSIENQDSKARISAIYNIIAFVMMIVFIGVLPRITDSLHPGNGGNPAFGNYDLDSNMHGILSSSYWMDTNWIMDCSTAFSNCIRNQERKISKMKRFNATIICCLLMSNTVLADSVEMADLMRSNGKIYVVVAVIAIIFIGLTAYLYRIDQRG